MATTARSIAIVGNGPTGVHLVNELHRLGYDGTVLLFGDEPHAPYNRVQLSTLLDGSTAWHSLDLEVRLRPHWQVFYHTRVIAIDTIGGMLTDSHGHQHSFDALVLATGSRPHIPAIPGSNLPGVHAFRNRNDAQRLLGRQVGSRHTAVIGGGLLGIETARAMARYSTQVTLIHHSPVLMNRQLDERASALLADQLQQQGVNVRLSTAVQAIDGAHRAERLLMRNEPAIDCDTVIFATGIRPNVELARSAGIAVGQGIRIDEHLQTSAPDIYAIGECAEFNGRIFGLVAPGLEQAAVLARRLAAGDEAASYTESLLSSSLKVVSTPVISAGEVGDAYGEADAESITFERPGCYRKLAVHRGRLVGLIGLGDWPESESLKAAVAGRRQLPPWRRWLFRRTGTVWQPAGGALPDNAILCNCRQVTAGTIRRCSVEGTRDLDAIGKACGAGTVCGSCHPLIARITASGDVSPAGQAALAGWALLACLLLLAFWLLPPLGASPRYDATTLEHWWTRSEYRQISGFTLIGLLALGLLVGLRKRVRWFRWLKFTRWRWFHVLLSTACLGLLFVHTGLESPTGLNLWLMVTFTSAVAVGIVAAVLTHLEARYPSLGTKTAKRWLTTAHLATFWPLPVLLSFHILSVYWF